MRVDRAGVGQPPRAQLRRAAARAGGRAGCGRWCGSPRRSSRRRPRSANARRALSSGAAPAARRGARRAPRPPTARCGGSASKPASAPASASRVSVPSSRPRAAGRSRRPRRTAARRAPPAIRSHCRLAQPLHVAQPHAHRERRRSPSVVRRLRACSPSRCASTSTGRTSTPWRLASSTMVAARVEAHRLGVEQRAGEDLGVVALQPGRGVGDQREARRVALGKAVLAEAADLLEDPLGELAARCPWPSCARPAARGGARCGPLRRQAAMSRRSWSASPGRVVGGDHGQPHHLLLEQRHAEGLLQHRLEAGVRVDRPAPRPCRRRR